MHLPDYQTIKFEQQERIDKAANARLASHVHKQSRLVRQASRRAAADDNRASKRAHRRAVGPRLQTVLRRLRGALT